MCRGLLCTLNMDANMMHQAAVKQSKDFTAVIKRSNQSGNDENFNFSVSAKTNAHVLPELEKDICNNLCI